MRIAAVLFDLDDTLIADEAATAAAFLAATTLAHDRYSLDPERLAQAVRHHARQLWQAAPTIAYCRAIGISSAEGLRARFVGDAPQLAWLRQWAPTYRREAWRCALAEGGVDDDGLAEALAARFIAERGQRPWVFADVEPVLTALRRRYRLAVVTNGASDLQRDKLAGAHLTSFFEAVVVSSEVGAGKPDSRPIQCALAALSVAPSAAVMIGDTLERDILGAQRAGVPGIWLNRSGVQNTTDVIPDAEIGDLVQLLARLSP